jgi:hypothetical protein
MRASELYSRIILRLGIRAQHARASTLPSTAITYAPIVGCPAERISLACVKILTTPCSP